MAEIYKTTPGELDIEMTHNEPWAMSFTVSKNLGGFSHLAGITTPEGDFVEMIVSSSIVDGVKTVIGLSLTDAQVTAVLPGIKKWFYRWIDPTTGERTILKGKAKIVSAS